MPRSKGRAHRLASMTSGRWRCACGRVFASAAAFTAHEAAPATTHLDMMIDSDVMARIDELAAQGWLATDQARTGPGRKQSPRTMIVERALRWYVERHAPRRVA